MTEEAPKRRRPGRAVCIAVGAIVGALLVALVGVNVLVRVAYAPFYDAAEKAFPIPGINEGFVPQDLDYLDGTGEWLFSGYVAGDGPSPVYKRDAGGSVARLTVELPDGTTYRGHGSAITSTDRYVFLAREGGYLVLDATTVEDADDGSILRAVGSVDLDFSPAFMNIEENMLYAGNFYFPDDYETPSEHRMTTPDGTENPAVMYAYPADDRGPYGFAEQAGCVFSIPAMVQGVAATDAGQLVLSTSYGLRSSHLLAYDMATMVVDGTFEADGVEVPLFMLDARSQVADIEAPPMTEGIESHQGLIYVSEESACNKYVFGKLYGAGYVYALAM